MLDFVQFPHNPWLKAALISSALYDNETIDLFLCIYVMNIVSQPELRQLKEINYWLSTYSLSLLFMDSGHDSR